MATERPPWEVIRAAADLLAERAAHFAGYEREFAEQKPMSNGRMRWDSALHAWSYDALDRNVSREPREWLSSLSPAVAEPLVAWLRATAEAWESYGEGHVDVGLPSNVTETALAFASRVLGSVDRG